MHKGVDFAAKTGTQFMLQEMELLKGQITMEVTKIYKDQHNSNIRLLMPLK